MKIPVMPCEMKPFPTPVPPVNPGCWISQLDEYLASIAARGGRYTMRADRDVEADVDRFGRYKMYRPGRRETITIEILHPL